MTRLAPSIGRLVRVSAAGLVASLAFATGASAAPPVPVTFDCQAKPPIGGPQQLILDGNVAATAPETVAPGAAFEIATAPDPMTVPAEAGGYPVEKIRGITFKAPVPAGATFVKATLTGGSGTGSAPPTVAHANGVITVSIPGPISGGATFQLPVLTIQLTASGAAGTKIESKLGGTSYTDPGLAFMATVKVGLFPVDVPTSCFPNPSPTLTTTAIA